MKRVVSKKQAAFIDSFTINNGTPELTLMERASEFVASETESFLKANTSARILVVSGFGNNGGDAVCAARILISKYPKADITVALIDDKKISESLKYQIERLAKVENENGRISSLEVVPESMSFAELAGKYNDFDIIIDGLFGVGLKRDVTGRFSDAVDYIKSQHDKGAKVIAVDIPSGIDGSTGQILGNAVKADVTVTFGALKTGHVIYPGRSYAGIVKVCDIGFDELAYYNENFGCDMEVLDTNDTSFLPKRSPDSNKGTYGKVLVAAGCDDMPGACILSSKAALRCGAGLVSACSSEKVLNSLITVLPEAVLSPEEKYLKNNGLEELFEKYDA
ncbi:MAG: NAD(P)H-hydrate epimerase, partial [Lachnospiraceae bacterium]|nr:NAD(P)H-hydrate epimerase [Lachnospiraceae bacterium]